MLPLIVFFSKMSRKIKKLLTNRIMFGKITNCESVNDEQAMKTTFKKIKKVVDKR